MNRKAAAVAVVAALLTASVATMASAAGKKDAAAVARGKYLVEQVAMCIDCHSPRNEKGEFIRERWLQGGPIGIKASVPTPKFVEVSPPIAGLPGWTDEQFVTLMTTGKDKKGEPADPPMPQYRMTKEDASAVAAYLRSLGKK